VGVQAPTERQTTPAAAEPAPAEPEPSEKIAEATAPSASVPDEPMPAEPAPSPTSETPAVAVTLPPPAHPEVLPPVSIAASAQQEQQRELRPEMDPAIATTLRAVVLGGAASAGAADAQSAGGQILAPRVSVKATATPVPLVLGPSVVPSPGDGAFLLAPRTAPDFAALQKLFMTNAALDLAGVASLAAALPGVRACVISGAAGNAAAGDFSHGVSAEDARAASANLARRAGALAEILHRGESDIAIFLHGETCVAAIIAAGGFVPGVRERLERAAELLAGAPPAR